MYNNAIKEPSTPVYLEFKNIPGRTFEEKKKFTKIMLCIFLIAMWGAAILMMTSFQIKEKISCTYRMEAYDCEVQGKTFLTTESTKSFKDVTQAVLETTKETVRDEIGHPRQETMYQMQFLDLNNKHLFVSGSWTNDYSQVSKEISDLNKLFKRNKNFTYTSKTSNLLLLAIAVFSLAPVFFILLFRHFFNNYVYEEISPNTYRAVLQGKGIGNMTNSSMGTLMGHFGREQKQNVYSIPTDLKKQGFKSKQYSGPNKSKIEVAKNLQDDELTDMQKDFYDRNN